MKTLMLHNHWKNEECRTKETTKPQNGLHECPLKPVIFLGIAIMRTAKGIWVKDATGYERCVSRKNVFQTKTQEVA